MSIPHAPRSPGRLARTLSAVAAMAFVTGCAADGADPPLAPPHVIQPGARANITSSVSRYDIQDWVLAQGSYCGRPENRPNCGPLLPGLDVTGWFDPIRGLCGVVDYAGFATRFLERHGGPSLGTTYDGSITERVLNDGRAEVTITLRTTNALAFAQPCEGAPFSPVYFGAMPADVLAGAVPALGSSFFSLTYIAPSPGYPLPEPIQILLGEPTYELVKISFHAEAAGVLHAGSGFDEGTLGRLNVQQVGRVTPGLLNREGDYPGDIFPVENVTLRPVGR